MGVFDRLVGQDRAVAVFRAAVAAASAEVAGERAASSAMSHAWLVTGPAGSGRSVAALAFAAALQCAEGGCGHCRDCSTVAAGTHGDVEVVTPEGLSIGVGQARDLILRASYAPGGDRWQVIVIEDADRLTEGAANVLLKAIEEPASRTVWVLCVPSAEDLPPTIRSRCRLVSLVTPSVPAIRDVLIADGVDPAMAAFAARAADGHVGRARRLATDQLARDERRAALALVESLGTVDEALAAAAGLVEQLNKRADEATGGRDAEETAVLKQTLGEGIRAKGIARGSAGALKELADRQKSRATRSRRDALDRALGDIVSLWRDVLRVQCAGDVELVNSDLAPLVTRIAQATTPAQTIRRIDAVLGAGHAIDGNVAPQLAVEAMALALRAG
jgi:DNA polymerase III subunit delta'